MTSEHGNKSIYKIIFLTLFFDLIGFSIIFPVFPQIAKHYLLVDADNLLLKAIFSLINYWSGFGPQGSFVSSMVLFGGIGGSIYSLMQFFFSPIWGALSDRVGRRPVLLLTSFGAIISYSIWFFSGSFTLFFISRVISGIMGGNISTATTVISDITDESNRSKGMAFVGIAFALGFIFGPALGGILSTLEVGDAILGIPTYHPFALIALFGILLAFINFVLLLCFFPETHIPTKMTKIRLVDRWMPLLSILPKRLRLINYSYFFYLLIFSGMEFTLTFLSFERFKYGPMQNAYLFIFSGFVMVLIQGGIVRRKAASIGESRLVKWGIFFVAIGLLFISFAGVVWLLYIGLLFLSAGSSLIIPCLTALVTINVDKQEQGKIIGIFRSHGAMARVLGPVMATMLFWNFGSLSTYFLGTLLMLIPFIIFKKYINAH